MNTEDKKETKNESRWLRIGVLTLTAVSPIINMLLERLRQRSTDVRSQTKHLQEEAQAIQAKATHRLDEITQASRQQVAEQARYLRVQANQLQSQARLLRDALRDEARQQKQLSKLKQQMIAAGLDWEHELVKRGGSLKENLVEQGTRISHNVLERGGKLTHELAEQGSKVTHELAERGERLLEPVRKRDSRFWTVVGFSVGLVAAGVVTYVIVRRRMNAQQEIIEEEQIELSESLTDWNNGNRGPLAGEIHHVARDGAKVTTLKTVEIGKVETIEQPEDATLIGVVSTKCYYPITTSLDAKDIVYFISEDEAMAQGYIPAQADL